MRVLFTVNLKKIEISYWIIFLILGGLVTFTSSQLIIASLQGGGSIVMESGGIKFSPQIFASNMLVITVIDFMVAGLAILALRSARKANFNK